MQRSVLIGSRSKRQRYDLVESEQLFIVKFRSENDPHILLNQVPSIALKKATVSLVSNFPDSKVFVYRFHGNSTGRDELKLEIRSTIASSIDYVGTIFEFSHSGIYQIYTGNIFLQFAEGVSESQCNNFLKQRSLFDKRKLHFGHHVHFVEPEESLDRNIFEHCLDIASSPLVECCHPELVTELHPTKSIQSVTSFNTDQNDWWLRASAVS